MSLRGEGLPMWPESQLDPHIMLLHVRRGQCNVVGHREVACWGSRGLPLVPIYLFLFPSGLRWRPSASKTVKERHETDRPDPPKAKFFKDCSCPAPLVSTTQITEASGDPVCPLTVLNFISSATAAAPTPFSCLCCMCHAG